MGKFIIRLIALMERMKIFKKKFIIDYSGKGVSLNQFYDGRHWTHRDKLKKHFIPLFRSLIEAKVGKERMTHFGIILLYNSRHDTDNVVGIEKLFTDSLRDTDNFEGWVPDDSKEYFKFFLIAPDNSLYHNSYRFILIKIA